MTMIICPTCGVGSDPWPDYLDSKGTAVIQRLSYCGHQVGGGAVVVVSPLAEMVDSNSLISPIIKDWATKEEDEAWKDL